MSSLKSYFSSLTRKDSRFSSLSAWGEDAGGECAGQPLCLLDKNRKGKENCQPELPHPESDEEQYHDRVPAVVGEDL